jgi:hypothetical protein
MKTRRKRLKKGGSKQKSHSLSQLWRFVFLASKGEEFNALQFGYNLGRLQEMCEPGVEGAQKNWWTIAEPLVIAKDWNSLKDVIQDRFRRQSGVDFDREFLTSKKVDLPTP